MTATALTRRSGARYLDWSSRAACLGMDVNLFFPPDEGGWVVAAEAKAICAACPVRAECLGFALESPERHGIWGGLAERERRQPRTRRSAYPGVTWNPRARKWVARATAGGRRVHLGTFADEAEAGRAAAAASAAPQASPIPQPTETAA